MGGRQILWEDGKGGALTVERRLDKRCLTLRSMRAEAEVWEGAGCPRGGGEVEMDQGRGHGVGEG